MDGIIVGNFTPWEVYANGIMGSVLCVMAAVAFLNFFKTVYKLISPKRTMQQEFEYLEAREAKRTERQKYRRAKWQRSFIYLCIQRFKAYKDSNCPILEWDKSVPPPSKKWKI